MLVGSEEEYYNKGKVLIAAANPDLMEDYIGKATWLSWAIVMNLSFVPLRCGQAASLSAKAQRFP